MAAVKAKRVNYPDKQKRNILEIVADIEDDARADCTKNRVATVARINLIRGYEHVTDTMIRRWSTSTVLNKRGRKINWSFEEQVVAQLVFTSIEMVDSVEQAVVVANVAYSHSVIRQAAEVAQGMPAFAEDVRLASSPSSSLNRGSRDF